MAQELPEPCRPPPEVTRDRFLVWRSPRLGVVNPHNLTNPVWAWLARNPEVNAWAANAHFGGPSSMEVGPGWCAQRYGQSTTTLPDGRILKVGGEHEDYYDPDFTIYNDLFLFGPGGEVSIYGYPWSAFPPTDFHSATVVGERVLLVGCLGYAWQRRPGHTPVYALDLGTLAIGPLEPTGDGPGWLGRHRAELSEDGRTLMVRGGQRIVEVEGSEDLLENHDDWSLNVEQLRWTRLTERRWPVWELARADGLPNHLWQIGSGRFHVGRDTSFDREQLDKLRADLGRLPDFELHDRRYAPPVPHEVLPLADEDEDEDEDEPDTARIAVEGVTVRYTEKIRRVMITIQGALREAVMAAVVEDARSKLEALEQTPYRARRRA